MKETSIGVADERRKVVKEGRVWPAAGSVDTEIGCLRELEVSDATTEVFSGVQA
jgi:hypothetical protein